MSFVTLNCECWKVDLMDDIDVISARNNVNTIPEASPNKKEILVPTEKYKQIL